jgi:hypothetical protein
MKTHSFFSMLLRKNRCFILIQLLTFYSLLTLAQTNISGVVNSYYKVVEIIPAKSCVRLNNVLGLASLQKVLLIQMKGASVITTNNTSFGDTTSLNNAGNYEVALICSIHDDSVFMFHNLLNNYTVTDKVQLIKFAEYYSANVIDTVKAAAWNNTNGTGGVIAISVSEDLALNAPIYADSSGFKGGAYVLSNGTCANAPFSATNYFYNASNTSPQNGSSKGEGVYDFPVSQSGGRGAPANGGGGGNNHNNGGGGGANLSAGGKGGGNSSSAGCTGDLHAEPGKALKNWNGQKVFFGGAGGAGHSNGILTISNGGGNGGGIVFIHATTLIGNGYKISANGGPGGTAVSDGASGGGAAGSVIMDVSNYSGSVILQANGGKGGNEDDAGTTQRCYGAGGGGSGGVIYFAGSVPAVTISVTGGTAGLESAGDVACNTSVPAAGGLTGSTISSYSVRQSTDPSSYCISLGPLPVSLIYFKASALQSTIYLQWRLGNPDLAKEIITEKLTGDRWSSFSAITADPLEENYDYTDQHPVAGINLYRLKIIEKNNSFFYSPVQQVIIKKNHDDFSIHPNPATDEIIITGAFPPGITLKLFDVSGKLLMGKKLSPGDNNTRMNISSLTPGIYIMQAGKSNQKLFVR